jgi:hypothetical protein
MDLTTPHEVVVHRPRFISMPHALVSDGRELSYAEFLPRETLGSYVDRNGISIARGPIYVWHNGHRVPEALWTRLIPRHGDLVVIRARMQGGGGSAKILRTVALVALAIAAPYAAAGVSGAAVAAGYSATAAAAFGATASAAILLGGSILVNALIPLPNANTAAAANQAVTDSPVYAIQAASNSGRLYEPMMLVFGFCRVTPDLGSNPSTNYVGDDQYLSQIFHFGLQPDMVIYDFRIGDSLLTNFQGVEIQRSGWDGAITLAPDNVDTIQGYDLNFLDGWNYRTTPDSTTWFEIELAAQLYSVDPSTGAFGPQTVIVQAEYRDVQNDTWIPIGAYSNPIYATHYWALGIYDIASGDSGGLGNWNQVSYGSLVESDHTNGEQYQDCTSFDTGGGDSGGGVQTSCKTYEWRWLPHPFQLGRPWQGVAPDPLIGYDVEEGVQLTGNSNAAVRQTLSVGVPLGQYEIRVSKGNPDLATTTDSNVVSVTQIRAFQTTPTDYTGQSRMAVRIKATSQLNGPINQLSALCQAFCNVWNGTDWVYTQTSNPAWWFLWYALGKRDANGQRIYGGGISADRIDVESIKAWGAYCTLKGWTFNYVLQQKTTVDAMLTMIARCGQGSYSWQTGKLGVIWDAPNQPEVALIGPFNIKSGTFSVSYVDATVDGIIGNFINPARDWVADQVRVAVPGAPVLDNPQTFDLDGVTDAALAGRQINLLAAQQYFMRRRVAWEMDIEGYVATRGDVVRVSHDLTVWGYAGRLTGGDRTTLQLDRAVPAGGTGWMNLRSPDGRMQAIQVSGVGSVDQLTILTPLPVDFPMPGDADWSDVVALDWAWQFDPLATPGRRLKIVSVSPTNDDGVQFEAVDDDPDYYLSETNPFAYTPPRDGSLLSGVVLALATSEQILAVASDDIQVRLDYVLSAALQVNIDYTINGQAYPTVVTSDRFATISAHTGDVIVATVTPVAPTGKGVAKSITVTVQGLLTPLPAVTGLTSVFRDGLTVLSWDPVSDVRDPAYEVRLGSTWENSATVAITPSTELVAVGNGLYFVAARFVTSKGVVVYGLADTLSIAGATLVRNVLVTVDEDPAWDGTASEGAFVLDGVLTLAGTGDILSVPDILALDDILLYGGVATEGIYQTKDTNVVDIGFTTPVLVTFSVSGFAINFADDILGVADILAMPDILGGSNQQHYKIQPQIRTATVAGDWTDWRDYVPGLLNARYFDVRLLLQTDSPLIVPYVDHFSWTIDVPDMIQKAESVAVPSAGLHVTFGKDFHAVPNIQITQLDAVNGDRFSLTNVTTEGFDIYFFNNATAIAAVMNYLAQGY